MADQAGFSGSLTIKTLDADAWEVFTAPLRPRGEVRISSLNPIARPSPWRHPIRWLRWNPLLRVRTTMVFPNCETEDAGDGALRLHPHPVSDR